MGGSIPALFVVPSVLPLAMCTWLGLVVWAGAHRDWKVHRLAREAAAREAAAVAAGSQLAVPARNQGTGRRAAISPAGR